jgi:DNA repair photolyase
MGSFLLHPAPLELSLGPCSYACRYCFVRLNKTVIKTDIRKLQNILQKRFDSDKLVSRLLVDNYPVVISNRSDPFSQTIYTTFVSALTLLTESGIKACFQTKGGTDKQLNEILDIIDYKACWYITISSDDVNIAKAMEPNAPNPESRFKFAEKLVKNGHVVQIAINPCVNSWIKQPVEFVNRLADIGVQGVWLDNLHINNNQSRILSQRDRLIIGDSMLEKVRKPFISEEELDFNDYLESLIKDKNIEFFNSYFTLKSNFYDPFRELYENTFPTFLDVNNVCSDIIRQSGNELGTLTFDEYWNILIDDYPLPEGNLNLRDYVIAKNASVTWSGVIDFKNNTFKNLVKLFWVDSRFKCSPCRTPVMAMAKDVNNNIIYDDNKLPLYVFDPDGTFDETTVILHDN